MNWTRDAVLDEESTVCWDEDMQPKVNTVGQLEGCYVSWLGISPFKLRSIANLLLGIHIHLIDRFVVLLLGPRPLYLAPPVPPIFSPTYFPVYFTG